MSLAEFCQKLFLLDWKSGSSEEYDDVEEAGVEKVVPLPHGLEKKPHNTLHLLILKFKRHFIR